MSKAKQAVYDQAFRYKKGLGQNFLYDDALLRALVADTGVGPCDDVLEVGPGSGSMTVHLAHAARRVLALELDEKLLPILRVTLEKEKNVRVVQGDVMRVHLAALCEPFLAEGFHVVTNLPYYITSPLLTMLLESDLPIRSISAMVQKEVSDKLIAAPGDEGYGPLSILCQYRTVPTVARFVPAACFTPAPKVDSAFVTMRWRAQPPYPHVPREKYFRVVRGAFTLRRKQILNAMQATLSLSRDAAADALDQAGVASNARAEMISMDEFARITAAIG